MAWIDRRRHRDGTQRYRIRDRINGEIVTVVEDAGLWKPIAEQRKVDYLKQKALGIGNILAARSLLVEEACDIFHAKHGPTLKGGVSAHYKSPFRYLHYHLAVIKRAWADRALDSIGKYDVRDLLGRYTSTGSVMRYLGVISKMFKSFAEWNEEGTLGYQVKLPPHNPATKWRKEMKSSAKRELPRDRVLSEEEWDRFKPHLNSRARAICEIALRRFLREADIKAISHFKIKAGMIKGLQEKTGELYQVPVLDDQPSRYDFRNFRKDFKRAQIAAGMNFPKDHPLHFTFRDLRRTGPTWAYQKTRNLVGISKMLGHRKISTTIRYLRIDDTDVSAIAKAVDAMANRDPLRGAPVEQIPKTGINRLPQNAAKRRT